MKNEIIFFKEKVRLLTRVSLSFLVIINGFFIIKQPLQYYFSYNNWNDIHLTNWVESLNIEKLLDIPTFIIGSALILMSIFMINGSRIAWVFSLFLLSITTFINLNFIDTNFILGYFSLFMIILLIFFEKLYNYRSLTSAGFVAVTCISALIIYSVLGSLYLGNEFSPKIKSIETAIYFSLISMTTVGYGDIVPISDDSRIFSITIILLGITVFTTSVIYVFGALGQRTEDIVKKRFNYMKDHFVIIGNTPIAASLYQNIKNRGLPVVSICDKNDTINQHYQESMIIGDLSTKDIYLKANIKKSKYIFIMNTDDSVSILSIINIMNIADKDKNFKLIVILNEDKSIDAARYLNPDILFTYSSLLSEILVKLIYKENISLDTIGDILFSKMENNNISK